MPLTPPVMRNVLPLALISKPFDFTSPNFPAPLNIWAPVARLLLASIWAIGVSNFVAVGVTEYDAAGEIERLLLRIVDPARRHYAQAGRSDIARLVQIDELRAGRAAQGAFQQ